MPDDTATPRQLEQLAALLAAIARKAGIRAEHDPAAAELLDLATKAEALAQDLMRREMN